MEKYTIKQIRLMLLFNQEEFANEIGMNVNTYIKKDKGISKLYLDEAIKVVEVANKYGLNITIDNIIPTPTPK